MAQPQGGIPAHQGHDPWPALGQLGVLFSTALLL
jgi:hypothetical protein